MDRGSPGKDGRVKSSRKKGRKQKATSEVGSVLGAVSVASFALGSSAVSVAPPPMDVQDSSNPRAKERRSSFDADDLVDGGSTSPKGSARSESSGNLAPAGLSTADIIAERSKARRPVKRFTSLSTVASESYTPGSPAGGDDSDHGFGRNDMDRTPPRPAVPLMKSANRPRPQPHAHAPLT